MGVRSGRTFVEFVEESRAEICRKNVDNFPPKGVKHVDHHAKSCGAHGGSDVERAGRDGSEFDVQEPRTGHQRSSHFQVRDKPPNTSSRYGVGQYVICT